MASDLWSLGLSLLEISLGMYPIPPPDNAMLVQLFGPKVVEDIGPALASPNPRTPRTPRSPGSVNKPMAIFELLEYIGNKRDATVLEKTKQSQQLVSFVSVNQPPPKLPSKVFSDQMRDFVDQCLKKNHAERPDLVSLMQHPWLEGVESDSIDIAEWVTGISKMPTPQ